MNDSLADSKPQTCGDDCNAGNINVVSEQPSSVVAEPISTAPSKHADRIKTTPSQWIQLEPPLEDGDDWLQLSSGEWLKGDFISLYSYIVEFDSDDLGILKIDWDDVKRIYSAGLKSVRIEQNEGQDAVISLLGNINLENGEIVIDVSGHQYSFSSAQIVSIVEGAKRESDYWDHKLSFGANVKSGNVDTVDTNLAANAKRQTSDSRFYIDYTANFSQAQDVETSNNHRITGNYDIFKNTKLFWRILSAEYNRDTFKNIDHQLSLGSSFGYHLIRDSKTEWEISGGLGGLYKRFVSVEEGEDIDNISPALAIGTRYDTEISSSLDYLLDFKIEIVDESSGHYNHHLLSTLSSELLEDLDLDVSMVWERIQKPQPDADGNKPERDDLQLIVSFTYKS